MSRAAVLPQEVRWGLLRMKTGSKRAKRPAEGQALLVSLSHPAATAQETGNDKQFKDIDVVMKTSPCLRCPLQARSEAFLREETLRKLKCQVPHG